MRSKRRIFIEEIDGDSAIPGIEQSRHLLNVLRLKVGDIVDVFDGKGGLREARLAVAEKGRAEVVFTGPKQIRERPVPWISLAVVPPKGQRMDTLVQMAQEIGLDELIPVITERAVQQEFSENRFARWKRVTVSAAKQCGANYLVDIRPTADLDELLKNLSGWDLRLICDAGPKSRKIREIIKEKTPQRVLLIVGPEGGFSNKEITAALNSGCAAVSLPTPVLRVETAAVFALSALCLQFDRSIPEA